MAKYVDVEALYCADCEYYGNCDHVTCDVKSFPEADVVEVVRCKDCRLRCPESITVARHCTLSGIMVDDDDFCSCGERRDNDG